MMVSQEYQEIQDSRAQLDTPLPQGASWLHRWHQDLMTKLDWQGWSPEPTVSQDHEVHLDQQAHRDLLVAKVFLAKWVSQDQWVPLAREDQMVHQENPA